MIAVVISLLDMVTMDAVPAAAEARTMGWCNWAMAILLAFFLGVVFDSVLVGLAACVVVPALLYFKPTRLDDAEAHAEGERINAEIEDIRKLMHRYADITIEH